MTRRSGARRSDERRLNVTCASTSSSPSSPSSGSNSTADDDARNKTNSPFDEVITDVDYYTLLGVSRDATEQEVKSAWRQKAKLCHPDLPHIGDEGQDLCVLLNEACRVLTDEDERAAYNFTLDEGAGVLDDGYTGMPLSRWCGPGHKRTRSEHADDAKDAVFVDELACIGCRNCVWCAGATFKMEPEYGRARVWNQWLNKRDEIDTAIESCPVNCIHWVDSKELPALEFVMQRVLSRVDVGIMMAGQGNSVSDVFEETAMYMQQRQKLEQEQELRRQVSKETRRRRQAAATRIKEEEKKGAKGRVKSWAETIFRHMRGNSTRDVRRTKWQEERNAAAAAAAAHRAHGHADTYSVPFERAIVPLRVRVDRRR